MPVPEEMPKDVWGTQLDKLAKESLPEDKYALYESFIEARKVHMGIASSDEGFEATAYNTEVKWRNLMLDFFNFDNEVDIESELLSVLPKPTDQNDRAYWSMREKVHDFGLGILTLPRMSRIAQIPTKRVHPKYPLDGSDVPTTLGPLEAETTHLDTMLGFYISYQNELVAVIGFTPMPHAGVIYVDQIQGGVKEDTFDENWNFDKKGSPNACKVKARFIRGGPEIVLFRLLRRFADSVGMELALRKPETIEWGDVGENSAAGASTVYDDVRECFHLREPTDEEKSKSYFSDDYYYDFGDDVE